MRSGISPVAKNIINIRYKKKPKFDTEKVKKIEAILKDLIDYGFADHVDEQLLDFNEHGKLNKIIDGKSSNDRSKLDGLGLQRFMEGDPQDEINELNDNDSVSSSNMDDSSVYGSIRNPKSIMRGDNSDMNFNMGESASVSNFRQDMSSS